jgi:hypothetical protein
MDLAGTKDRAFFKALGALTMVYVRVLSRPRLHTVICVFRRTVGKLMPIELKLRPSRKNSL